MRTLEEFWMRLVDVEAGMLGLTSQLARFPAAPCLREECDEAIWFVTTQADDFVTALTCRPEVGQFVIADGASGLYGSLNGELSLCDDASILDELSTPATMSMIGTSKKDLRLRLLRFIPQDGTIWYSSMNGMTRLCEFRDAVYETSSVHLFTSRVG